MNQKAREAACSRESGKDKDRSCRTHSGVQCPKCGAAVPQGAEFCPQCGARLVNYCTFCGMPMNPADIECPECGMPANGIKCPQCGTLNQRPFCRSCGAPLTRAAERALQKAKEDPLLRKCEELTLEAEETPEPDKKKAIVQNVNELLSKMLPLDEATPQEKRVFYTARKILVTRKVHQTLCSGWVCNYCGCTHNQPCECFRPELGGKWIVEEIVTEVSSYERPEE